MDKEALDVIAVASCRHTMHDELGVLGEDDVAEAERILAALGANGYVVVPRHLLDELLRTARYASNALRLSASAPVGSSEYELAKLLDSTAAAVEAVGPTTPETCSTCNQPLDSPPCSLNRDTGWSGHTVDDDEAGE